MSDESPRTDLTGRTVGEYEITARIGVGGMGVVYEGKHPLIGKRVAVKVLLPSLSNEKELVDRFLSEARAVNEIRHRGIVDIFSFGQLPDGAHYFVMELLQGEAFDKLIRRRAPLPVGEALSLMEEVLDALDSAHQAGIIHRDIKPSNIFLVDTGRGRPYVKLLDFGIAKLGALQGEATPQTRASVIVGTPDYMSPEQAKGLPIAPATDVYAIACVLYEMLTKKRLFKGENQLQTMWMHVEDKPPFAASLNPAVPKELDEVLHWALEKKVESRPASAGEFRQHLEAIRRQLPVDQQPMTPAPLSGRGRPLSVVGSPDPRQATPAPDSSRPPTPMPSTPSPKSKARPAVPPAELLMNAAKSTFVGPPPGTALVSDAPADAAEPTRIELPPETRPPRKTGTVPKLVLESKPTEMALEEVAASPPRTAGPQFEEPPFPNSDGGGAKLALVGGFVAVLVLAAMGGVVFLLKDKDPETTNPPTVHFPPGDPAPGPAKVPAPVVKAAPPAVADPVPAPVVKVVPVEASAKVPEKVPEPVVKVEPEKAPDKAPVKPPEPAKGSGLTPAKLEARLAKLEARLVAKEAQSGEKDRVLRQFLDQAKSEVSGAQTDAQRRDAWKFLDEVAGQFPK